MTRNAVAVFGVLRYSDEHELETWQVAKRARVRSRQAVAALRDLRKLGICQRREDEAGRVLYGLVKVLAGGESWAGRGAMPRRGGADERGRSAGAGHCEVMADRDD